MMQIQKTHQHPLGLSGALCLGLMLMCASVTAQPMRVPPAAVPDEVIMPRPAADEVLKAQALWADFLQALAPADRAMIERYPDLVTVNQPRVNLALIPNLSPNFRDKHEANKAIAAQGGIDVLFMGDSITDWWRNETGPYAGKPVYDAVFSDLRIANFGIAGDTTQGVLYRLANGEAEGYSPRAVMLMIGTNNTRDNTVGEIAEGVGAVVLDLEQRFPDANILLLAIFPRAGAADPLRSKVMAINEIIARLGQRPRVTYMDIGEIFLGPDGNIPVEIMSDGLHPTTTGYQRWADAVNQPLRALLD
jgi:lysophospholipase L1-like esterase